MQCEIIFSYPETKGAGADIMILAVIFPKITKKGEISIKFYGQVTHYLHGSSQRTQIGK